MKEIGLYSTIATEHTPSVKAKEVAEGESKASFGAMLKGAMSEVSKLQNDADNAINELAAGENTDIHRTMIALEKADVSFQLMMQVRNKVIAAYEEIMRMQV